MHLSNYFEHDINMPKNLLIFLLIFTKLSLFSTKICILVHGTWGQDSDWYQSSGDFYQTLKEALPEQVKIISFRWSGLFDHVQRHLAGRNLANLINSYPTGTKFILVGHSHGGNVGIIASQQLQKEHQIENFYALGTPIDTTNYLPNMQVIKNFYNIFSFGDLYQTVLGMHERFLHAGPRIYNINIEIGDKRPDHEELHCPQIAKWLPHLPQQLAEFTCNNHFFAKFNQDNQPTISIETQLAQKLERDLRLHQHLCAALPSGQPDWRVFTNFANPSTSSG